MEPDLPTRMMQLITGAWVSQAVCAAATLGVADELAKGPLRVEAIADGVGTDADALHRLLRALAGLGLVEETDDREFALTELGELLTAGAPNSLRGVALMFGSHWHRRAWTGLAESIRTGESAFVRAFGDTFSVVEAAQPASLRLSVPADHPTRQQERQHGARDQKRDQPEVRAV